MVFGQNDEKMWTLKRCLFFLSLDINIIDYLWFEIRMDKYTKLIGVTGWNPNLVTLYSFETREYNNKI